jgi:hypothetical protein
MPLYTFSQNNSGGRFSGPALYVIVEAANGDEANYLAVDNGVYFDGCNEGMDCSCCGDRWSRQWRDIGSSEPMIYGKRLKNMRRGKTT